MAGRRPAAGGAGGGGGIQAPGPRLTTALGAVAALGAVDAVAISAGGRLAPLEIAAAAAATTLLVGGLALRRSGTVPWAVVLAAAGYLAGRAGHSTVDGRAVLVGVLLLLAAELATWSADEHPRIRPERAVLVRRLVLVGGLAAAALAVDAVLLVASSVSSAHGTALATIGTAAAVAAVGVALRLARRPGGGPSPAAGTRRAIED